MHINLYFVSCACALLLVHQCSRVASPGASTARYSTTKCSTAPYPHPPPPPVRQMTVLAFFQRKHMFHRIVSALKFLAATISNSCGFVQRPATNGLHILFSNSNYSHFLYHHSEPSRRDGEGGGGGWGCPAGIFLI